MQDLPDDDYAGLDELLARDAPSLRPVIRWLAIGPRISRILFPNETREPTFGELGQLTRLVQDRAPNLLATMQKLVLRSDHAEVLHAELQLDVLLAQEPESWSHPVQVLERPRADYTALLQACEQRLEEQDGAEVSGTRIESVREKLARAVRIATTAKRRREQRMIQQQREERRRRRQASEKET